MEDNRITREEQEKYSAQFSEKKLEGKLARFAKKASLGTVYYVLLLWEVLKSGNIPQKLAVTGALGYFISPIDLIPDLIPLTGFADDASVLLLALAAVASAIKPAMKTAAKERLREWFDFKETDLPEDYR